MSRQGESDRLKKKKIFFNRPIWSSLAAVCIVLATFVGIGAFLSTLDFASLSRERTLASNVGFFLLINLNIILVMVLGFLVVKNIVKLVLDRRRNILGSRLQVRLITAFVGLSLVPTVLLFLVAKGILSSVLQGWFSPQVAASVDGAVKVAKFHYDVAEAQVYRFVHHMSRDLAEIAPYISGENGHVPGDNLEMKEIVSDLLQQKREEYGLFQLAILDPQGEPMVESLSLEAKRKMVDIPKANLVSVRRAMAGAIVVRPEQSANGEFLRGYAPLETSLVGGLFSGGFESLADNLSPQERLEAGAVRQIVIATLFIPGELGQVLAGVVDSYDDYKELRTYRRPLASTYLLTLIVVTLLIVFAAIWVGFYLARGLTVPIRHLAEGTQQVAHGNLEYQLDEVGDDELSVLVRSFNTMTQDLKSATSELVERRRYMETVLASVGVGVISLDLENRITTLNVAAASIMGLDQPKLVIGRLLPEALPRSIAERLRELLLELYGAVDRVLTDNFSVTLSGDAKHVQITATKLVDDDGLTIGVVILLDDVTELVSAQRMAAWREVARRIAHEIKNPLTPIQLCAQRMQRRLSGEHAGAEESGENSPPGARREVLLESTETIIRQVEILRTLVNEFSQFARMPQSRLKPDRLNSLVEETVSMYHKAHREICFSIELDSQIPIFEFDREQMGRAIVNLIDNSIASVSSVSPSETKEQEVFQPRIEVKTTFDESLRLVVIRVSDNGLGIGDRDKRQIFEPYFSTKKGGTGLGLAIVQTVVADHNGYIRVRDNTPRGAVFVIELPVSRGFPRPQE